MIIKGVAGIIKQSDNREFIPDVGWSHEVTYQGAGPKAEAACYSVGRKYSEYGYKFTVSKIEGTPGWRLTCTSATAGDGSEEEPQESWSWRSELVQKSIWQHPSAVAEELKYTLNSLSDLNFTRNYRKGIEQTLDDGMAGLDSDVYNPVQYPFAYKIFKELKRGADSYETDTVVLQLQRATTINYSGKLKVGASTIVYTSKRLFGAGGPAEDCPDDVKEIMPGYITPDPDAVDDAIWGWRERGNTGGKEGWTRFIQGREWVYAAWSRNLYPDIVS